jgi:hypothetical protein
MDRVSGIGDMKASNEVHSVINLGIEKFLNSGMRESKITPSTIPGQKPEACLSANSRPRVKPRGSGLILSGAFAPVLKAEI